jgi:hypothetical protein
MIRIGSMGTIRCGPDHDSTAWKLHEPILTPPSQRKSTTPVLEIILQEIENRKKRRDCSTQPRQPFELDENGYKVLQQFLEEDDYAKHKLRYDSNKGLI